MFTNRKKAQGERSTSPNFGQQRTTEFKFRFCNSSSVALAPRLENHCGRGHGP